MIIPNLLQNFFGKSKKSGLFYIKEKKKMHAQHTFVAQQNLGKISLTQRTDLIHQLDFVL